MFAKNKADSTNHGRFLQCTWRPGKVLNRDTHGSMIRRENCQSVEGFCYNITKLV